MDSNSGIVGVVSALSNLAADLPEPAAIGVASAPGETLANSRGFQADLNVTEDLIARTSNAIRGCESNGMDIGEIHQMLLRSRVAVPKIKINVDGRAVAIPEEQPKEKPLKRRKSSASQPKDDSMFEGRQDESESKGERTAVIMKKKKKKHKRRSQDAILVVDKLETEDAFFESNIGSLIDLESYEDDIDLTVVDVSSDDLLSHDVTSSVLARVKSMRQSKHLRKIPFKKLVHLIRILSLQIIDSKTLSLSDTTSDTSESQQWRQVVLDRIYRSVEAALSVLCIMTAPKMTQKVLVEESVDLIVSFASFQLKNNIYPEYDALCAAIAGKKKEGAVDSKKRGKKRPTSQDVVFLCSQMMEIVTQIADLVERHRLTFSCVNQIASLGIQSFFVENMGPLQLRSLKVIRSIFSQYEVHREYILQEILNSLAKLPTLKRGSRNYELLDSPGSAIQMMTALVLQLVQSSIAIPSFNVKRRKLTGGSKEGDIDELDVSAIMATSFSQVMLTIRTFLRTFVNRCGAKTDDADYRPLLENFIVDLLLLVKRPEWPAADVFLHQLSLLLGHFLLSGGKNVEMGFKMTAIEHLGTIASATKAGLLSNGKKDKDTVIKILQKNDADSSSLEDGSDHDELTEVQRQCLQRQLLQYLSNGGCTDLSFFFAARFFLAQWIDNNKASVDRALKEPPTETMDDAAAFETSQTSEILDVASQRKDFLEDLVDFAKEPLHGTGIGVKLLSFEEASSVARFFSYGHFVQRRFDYCLAKILHACKESTVTGLRTKSLRSLSTILSADSSILTKPDVQHSVHMKLKDPATSVREAALEIVGKYVLACPSLLAHYYAMLSERLHDPGRSVRKRAIAIMRDVCLAHPSDSKVPEMCVSMVKRINDEPTIRKLVSKTFHQLWFSKLDEKDASIDLRVHAILETISACRWDQDWFEKLLENLLNDDAQSTSVLASCRQIVDALAKHLLECERDAKGSSQKRLLACVTTLHLFAICTPQLLVKHVALFQPFLTLNCEDSPIEVSEVVRRTALTLDLIVPLAEALSDVFLAKLEESLVRVMFSKIRLVISSGIRCLGTVVNKVTKNYGIVGDAFEKFYGCLVKARSAVQKSSGQPLDPSAKSSIVRSLYTVGLMCNHFNLKDVGHICGEKLTPQRLLEVFSDFSRSADSGIQVRAFAGLGFLCRRYPELLPSLEDMYMIALKSKGNAELKQRVIENLTDFFVDHGDGQDSSENGDATLSDKVLHKAKSGQCSSLAEKFGSFVRIAALYPVASVRNAAANAIFAILKRGLVHPLEFISFLIALTTDVDPKRKAEAEELLTKLDSKYPRFVQTQGFLGMARSFAYQRVLAAKDATVRGFVKSVDGYKAVCHHLYTLLRDNRQQRRNFLGSLVRSFQKETELSRMLFLADNLAAFSYSLMDEPLFVVQQLSTVAATIATKTMAEYSDVLASLCGRKVDDVETPDELSSVVPEFDTKKLTNSVVAGHSCLLLLSVKAHIKLVYGLSESKCRAYSTAEKAKVYDKLIARKSERPLDAAETVILLDDLKDAKDGLNRMKVFHYYFKLKQSVFLLESTVSDEEDEGDQTIRAAAEDDEGLIIVKKKPRRSSSSTSGAGIKKRRRSSATSGKSAKKRKQTADDDDEEMEEEDDAD